MADLALASLVPTPAPAPVKDKEEERRKLNERTFEAFVRTKDGQLKMTDETEVSRQRGVVWAVLKQVGNSIMDGRDLSNLTLPIDLFAPRSLLEAITEPWAFAPNYLTAAAQATDPLERFKLVVTFVLAGIHLAPAARKPFNPILGETYQAGLSDGAAIFCEQISHHPPISAWQLVGPNNMYHFHGVGQMSAAVRGTNSLKGYQIGRNVVEFADGTKISFTLPVLCISGVLFGERTLHYEEIVTFRDEKHKLHADVAFNAEAIGFIKSLFSKQKQPMDYVRGDIFPLGADGKKDKKSSLCIIEGSWLSSIKIGDKEYWNFERDLPSVITPCEEPLASDSRNRTDLVALLENDVERAKNEKLKLEEEQRFDAKLRAHTPKPKPGKTKEKQAIIYKDVLVDDKKDKKKEKKDKK